MKLFLLSFLMRGAIGDYNYLLVKELVKYYKEIFLYIPDYFNRDLENIFLIKYRISRNKIISFFNLINPLFTLKLIKIINDIKPDLVHILSREGYPPTPFLSIYLKLQKIPFVITLHNPEPHPTNTIEKINAILGIISLKLANGIHIHSKIFVKKVKELGINENKIFVIPHGSFAPLFKDYIDKSIKKENQVLFFGRLEKYKGLEYLIEAGLKIEKFKIVIAGPGRLDKKLLRKIKKSEEKFVLINKYLSKKEITELFQKSKICVLPYIQATQSSIPLISAFFKVSVVATKVGAFIEDIPLVNGILVEPKDVESLIKGIQEALDKNPYYPKEREFESLAKYFIEMYEKVLNTKKDNFQPQI